MSLLSVSSLFGRYSQYSWARTKDPVRKILSHFTPNSLKNPLGGFYLPLSQGREWIYSGYKEGSYTAQRIYEKTFDYFPKSNLNCSTPFTPKFSEATKTEIEVGLLEMKATAGAPGDPGASVPVEEPGVAASTNILSPFPLFNDVISKVQQKALAIFPLFLIALYTSKEEHLQNVNLTIKSSDHPKVYQIGIGVQDDSELSIAFEVQAGKPVRFLHEKEAFTSDILPKAIFKPQTSFTTKVLGPIKHLIWKRQDAYTSCNIIIEDAGNPLLQNGPLTAYFEASDREGFYLLHKDPNITPDNAAASDFVVRIQDANFASYKALNMDISDPLSPNEEHQKQIVPLLFDQKQNNQYLSISQWQ